MVAIGVDQAGLAVLAPKQDQLLAEIAHAVHFAGREGIGRGDDIPAVGNPKRKTRC